MSKTVVRGFFYAFDRSKTAVHGEVGAILQEEKARLVVKNGGDVYTLFKEDAYRLAMSVSSGRAELGVPTRDACFSHYHPGGVHPTYVSGHPKARDTPGHVFFGERDEQWSVGHQSAFRRLEAGPPKKK